MIDESEFTESDFAEHDIEDAPDVQWAMLRVQDLAAKIAAYEKQADEMLGQIYGWLDEKTGKMRLELRAEGEKLEAYLREMIEVDPEGPKGLDLPAGRIDSHAGGLSYKVTDQRALVAWLEKNKPEAVRPPKPGEPTPDINKLKKLVEGVENLAPDGDTDQPGKYTIGTLDAGERVPGLEVVRGERSFTITTVDGIKFKDGERVFDVK